eukprot:2332356-Prymnesium_polylepis.1
MQRVSRADSGKTARKAVGNGRFVGNAQRAVGGGSARLPAETRAKLEDVVVGSRPLRHRMARF